MTPALETRAAEAMARASQAGRLRVPVERDGRPPESAIIERQEIEETEDE